MGKIIAVDSVVYNLAGDPTGRPSYLKSLVVQKQLSKSDQSMAEIIRSGYGNSPALKLKAFYRWAKRAGNYDLVGMPTGRLEVNGTVSAAKVAAEIGVVAGTTVAVRSAKVSYADPYYWAERWVLNNYPQRYDTAWEFDYFDETNTIRIDFVAHPNETFAVPEFNYETKYLYAYYSRINNTTGNEGNTRVLIYRLGSGNIDLDFLIEEKTSYGEFFPFIPIRLKNKFLSSTHLPAAFAQTQKAYKKATGSDLNDLINELKVNDSLGDIDHAYISFGVSLNTKDDAAKKYIYKFFETLQLTQEGGPTAYEDWMADLDNYKVSGAAWDDWVANGKVGPAPNRNMTQPPFTNKIRIRGTGDVNSHYDVRLKWSYVRNFTRGGKGKPGAKVGELWFTTKKVVVGQHRVVTQMGDGWQTTTYKDIESIRLRLHWQRTKWEYTYLDVMGAEYRNFIYKGKSQTITPKEAMDDPEDSGFIVPLHYGVWSAMNLVDKTQMSTACVFAVFNCYKVKKTKWYQSSIFQVFLVIVIAIVSVLFTGGAGFGLLGAHMAIGTTLGLTGMAAAIMGSVVNALAAFVLTSIIQQVASGFGAFGAMLSAILGIVIGSVASSMQSGALAFNWGDLLKVDNLIKLTQAVGDTMVAMVNEDTLGIQQDWADFQENASEQALKIQQAFFDQFGYGAGVIDPMMLTDQSTLRVETPSTFLNRTLMTGSDIAEMSQELLNNFSEYSLVLPDAFSQ